MTIVVRTSPVSDGVCSNGPQPAGPADRYERVVRLANAMLSAFDWTQLLLCVGQAFAGEREVSAKLWVSRPDGFALLGAYPAHGSEVVTPRENLREASHSTESMSLSDGTVVVPLRSVGVLPMLLELHGLLDSDLDFSDDVAHVVSARAAYLAVVDPKGAVHPALRGTEESFRAMRGFSNALQPFLAHDRITAFLLTAGDRAIELFAVGGSLPVPDEEAITSIDEFGLRDCVLMQQPQLTRDIMRERVAHSRGARILGRAGFRSSLAVPLRLHGKSIGILQFLSRSTGFYSEEDIKVAQDVADHAAPFIDHMRRQESVRPAALREATESERARFATHIMTTARVTLSQAQNALSGLIDDADKDVVKSDARIARVAELVDNAQAEISCALADIAPPAVRSRSFEDVIRHTVGQAAETNGIKIDVHLIGDVAGAAMTARRLANGVLKWALQTAAAAGASQVAVSVTVDDDLLLSVVDNGAPGQRHVEIELAATAETQSIAECVQALGGRIDTEYDFERGTALVMELPRFQPVRRDLEDERWRAVVPESQPARSIRAFILDQQGVRRVGFTHFLEVQDDVRVVGHAATLTDARRSLLWLQPDVVFVDADVVTPATVREIRCASTRSIVIGLASRIAQVSVAELVDAGAAGVLPQDLERSELISAISDLIAGKALALDYTTAGRAGFDGAALNSRELAMLELIVEGRTNIEIGAQFFLAPKTIERYVATITRKVGARNRAHLVAVAIRRGLVCLPF